MTLHIPAPVLERLSALAALDAQSEPHSSECYHGLIAFSAAALAASNEPGAVLTLAPVGIVWDERLVPFDDIRGDHDSPLSYVAREAADEWVDAQLYAEGVEPMERGGGNLC